MLETLSWSSYLGMVYSFTTTRLEASEHDEAPRDLAALTIPLDLEMR